MLSLHKHHEKTNWQKKEKKKKFCYALNSVLCFQAQILKELRPQRLTLNKMEDLKGIGGLSL